MRIVGIATARRPMSPNKLTDLNSHFAFGENWASYAKKIGEPEIEEAERGLLKLIPRELLDGRTFLDIGCGSGLHALAAARLGAARITAIDIDPKSVSTTRTLLEESNLTQSWQASQTSVLTLDHRALGTFDIVYSWGVLHHTGAMWPAIERAAKLVAANGLFAFALYRATRLDAFWTWEKQWYSSASPLAQKAARILYTGLFRVGFAVTGRNFNTHVANYRSARGMDFSHDVHDWLGGFPYETAIASEVAQKMTELGFTAERVFVRPKEIGLFGSGCDEYVYRRRSSNN